MWSFGMRAIATNKSENKNLKKRNQLTENITGLRPSENTGLQYIIAASLVELSETPECPRILLCFARHCQVHSFFTKLFAGFSQTKNSPWEPYLDTWFATKCTFPSGGGSCCQPGLKFKWTNQSWPWKPVASGRCRMPHHKGLRKAEALNFKANFSFFTRLSAAEAHAFGVKFIGLYGTVIFIAVRDFSCWGGSNLWSDVWPAMDGVVCL